MEAKQQPQFAEKIQNILTKLDKAEQPASKQENIEPVDVDVKNKQTVADDFSVNANKEKEILHYEQIIRKTLELFNINYDDLIRMDGKSAYNKAIDFYPHLLDKVKQSKCPPLTAITIAKKMEPYMQFTAKYGTSLEDIKKNLKQELNEEEKQNKQKETSSIKQSTAKPVEVQQATVFSDVGNAITQDKQTKEKLDDNNLASFFVR